MHSQTCDREAQRLLPLPTSPRNSNTIFRAPELEEILRAECRDRGEEPPANSNLALQLIERFRRAAKHLQELRRACRTGPDRDDRHLLLREYAQTYRVINGILQYGSSFEKAYREYIHSRREYRHFCLARAEVQRIETGHFDGQSLPCVAREGRLERRASVDADRTDCAARPPLAVAQATDVPTVLKAMRTIHGDGTPEFQMALREFGKANRAEGIGTSHEFGERLARLRLNIQRQWENPMVRYFWDKRQL